MKRAERLVAFVARPAAPSRRGGLLGDADIEVRSGKRLGENIVPVPDGLPRNGPTILSFFLGFLDELLAEHVSDSGIVRLGLGRAPVGRRTDDGVYLRGGFAGHTLALFCDTMTRIGPVSMSRTF